MASPRTRRVLRELKFKDGNNVSELDWLERELLHCWLTDDDGVVLLFIDLYYLLLLFYSLASYLASQ